MQKAIVLIPALDPNEKLIRLIEELHKLGFCRLIIIDDGSGPDKRQVFSRAEQEGCIVVHQPQNIGKGAALKTGIRTAIKRYGSGNTYITADCDGQHLPEDILKVAEELERFPNALILGVRDFSAGNVPLRSLIGNRVTAIFFRMTNGITCPDTQTGLRGISAGLEDLALSEEGNRYEYEMNFLSDAARLVTFKFVPVQTVYEDGNRVSHFRPVLDSVLVYGRFLRFAIASFTGALVDYFLFCLFMIALPLSQVQQILVAITASRIGSGIVNFLLNRYFSFRSRRMIGQEAVRYGILFLCQMGASAGFVSILSQAHIPVIVAKLVVDTILFFVSFIIQKNWVFQKEKE